MGHSYYPIALDLAGKHCLVVGGGTIAADKVQGLLAAGARVSVISPSVEPRLARFADRGEIEWRQRSYRSEDLDGVYLAYGATDDVVMNARVTADARSTGILVNAVDDPPNCDFFAVAMVRRGDLQIAISTNGRSPAFARWMREHLDESLPAELGDLLTVLGDLRQDMKARGPIPGYDAWKTAISDEVLQRIHHGDLNGARNALAAGLAAAATCDADVPALSGRRA